MSATEAYFVTRTMRALELLAFGPLSVPQLAETMQIHPRTARRMITRLADEEYVTLLDGSRRRYALTMRVVALAGQWLEHSRLPRLASPFVALLDAQTGLTPHLVIPAYDRVLCLVHSGEGGVPTPRLREMVPAHCTAAGKALLAEREEWRESVLTRPLAAFTDRTVTDPGAIAQELEAARGGGTRSRTASTAEACTPSPQPSMIARATRSPPSALVAPAAPTSTQSATTS